MTSQWEVPEGLGRHCGNPKGPWARANGVEAETWRDLAKERPAAPSTLEKVPAKLVSWALRAQTEDNQI